MDRDVHVQLEKMFSLKALMPGQPFGVNVLHLIKDSKSTNQDMPPVQEVISMWPFVVTAAKVSEMTVHLAR